MENIETLGVLGGKQEGDKVVVIHLIIPQQEPSWKNVTLHLKM